MKPLKLSGKMIEIPIVNGQCEVREMVTVGQQITIKPEWRDEGDEDYIWTAMEEPHPVTGYFKVRVTPKPHIINDLIGPSVMEIHISHVEAQK